MQPLVSGCETMYGMKINVKLTLTWCEDTAESRDCFGILHLLQVFTETHYSIFAICFLAE